MVCRRRTIRAEADSASAIHGSAKDRMRRGKTAAEAAPATTATKTSAASAATKTTTTETATASAVASSQPGLSQGDRCDAN